LVDAELLAGGRAEPLWTPRWIPDDVHVTCAYAGNLLQASLHLFADHHVSWTALSGKSHIDRDVLLVIRRRFKANIVNEPEIDDVNRNFRIVAVLKSCEYVFLSDDWHLTLLDAGGH